MGLFSRKKKEDKVEKPAEAKVDISVEEKKSEIRNQKSDKPTAKTETKKSEKNVEDKKEVKKSAGKIKGASSPKAYDTLLRPLITEKASELGAFNKYVFAIDPRMNKIDVKKAIRTIYAVDPVKVNVLNFSGKKIRYGKTRGKTKHWKKAVVTLKKGDSIEVYEGV